MADTMHALEKNPNWKGRRDSVVMGVDGEIDLIFFFIFVTLLIDFTFEMNDTRVHSVLPAV